MKDGKRKGNTKKISKLKKSQSWLLIPLYLIIYAAVAATVGYAMYLLAVYNMHSKFDAEAEMIRYLAQVYDRASADGMDEGEWDLLRASGYDFIIREANGALVYGDASNTCGQSGKSLKDFEAEGALLYQDTVYPYVYVDRGGQFAVRTDEMDRLFRQISRSEVDANLMLMDESEIDTFEPEVELLRAGTEKVMQVPVWVGYPVADGSRIFIGKGFLTFRVNDLSALGIASLMITVLVLIILALFLINLASNRKSRKRSLKLLFMDLATGGQNRTWFLYTGENLLKSRLNAARTYAVVDLNFMKYNTFVLCHSVAEGEEILRKIHGYLSSKLGKKELLAHGFQGDFMMLLRMEEEQELRNRLEEMLTELGRLEKDHSFTFHAGVRELMPVVDEKGRVRRRKDLDFEQECNHAVTARVTLDGREESATAFFDEKLIEANIWQDRVEEHCRGALEKEEFLVYYQPKYDPVSGTLKGAEALIRWQSPELGFVPPGRFIPIFESNGFITNIDHYMIAHVAADQKRWLDQGKHCVPVSVNVSRAHFIEDDLAEQIRDLVDGAGAPRNLIEIELTESAFFDDKNALVRTIKKLKEYGFTVSMDDFGSGYSSLNSLKDIPLDVLKLDAEFFRGEAEGDRGNIIVSETIRL
ncbi:MAG: EAL domain-containing protein, partial [Lachnospiraceae bacterium]|nr:EAL domain-containing protein [Lachnospiraceae bacterium]